MAKRKKYKNLMGGVLGRALKLREFPAIGFVGQVIMQCLAVDIPKSVKFG